MKIGAGVKLGRRSGVGAGVSLGRRTGARAGIKVGRHKLSAGAGFKV